MRLITGRKSSLNRHIGCWNEHLLDDSQFGQIMDNILDVFKVLSFRKFVPV